MTYTETPVSPAEGEWLRERVAALTRRVTELEGQVAALRPPRCECGSELGRCYYPSCGRGAIDRAARLRKQVCEEER